MNVSRPAQVTRRSSSARHRNAFLLLLSLGLAACGQQASSPATPAAQTGVQLEAEQGTITPLAPQDIAEPRTGGKVIRDQNASGGQAVLLLSNHDAVKFKLPANFASGRYTVKLVGRGEFYKGWPTVALENDRRGRMSITTVDTGTYAPRGFGQFDLRPNQEMYVSFTNDLYDGPGKDRNVVVDYLLIEPVKTPPAVNQPPTVTLQPLENGLLTPSDGNFEDDNNIILRATASDPDGRVARVEFYYGQTKIGEDTTAPYTFVYPRNTFIDTAFPAPFSARVVDDRGATATSEARTVALFSTGNFGNPVVRALNLGGPDVQTQGYTPQSWGVNFAAGETAGITTNGIPTVLPTTAPLSPAAEPNRAALVRTALTRRGGLTVNVPVPNAPYNVYFWVRAEDATAYDLQMEGQTLARFSPGEAGQWKRLGPVPVTVGDGVLNVASTGTATASFAAIEVYRRPQAGDSAPTVAFNPRSLISHPGGQPLTLLVDASDPQGIARVEFFARPYPFGPVQKIGEATSAPYRVVWENTPASGLYDVRAYATDTTGVTSFDVVNVSFTAP